MGVYITLFITFGYFSQCFGCLKQDTMLKKISIGGFNRTSTTYNVTHDTIVEDDMLCLALCISEKGCDVSVICLNPIQRCFLLSGEIITQLHSNNTEYSSCYTYATDACAVFNEDSSFDTACRCPSGLIGYRCQLINPDNCESTLVWSSSLVMRSDGVIESGTVEELRESVGLGKSFKVMVQSSNVSTIYNIESAGHQSSSSVEIWGTSGENLVIDYINLQTQVSRHRIEVMSNKIYASHWSYSLDSKIETVTTDTQFSMKWFIRNKMNSLSPCLDTNNNVVISGSTSLCKNFIQNGSNIALFDSFTADTVTDISMQENIRADRPFSAAHSIRSSGNNLKKPMYILLYSDHSNSADSVFRWYVKNAEYMTGSNPANSGKWFVDDCWHEAVRISESGNVFSGSLSYLISSILKGIPVRASLHNYTTPLNDIRITNGAVRASMVDYLDRTNVIVGKMVRRYLLTNGTVFSLAHVLEKNISYGSQLEVGESKWFVESRKTWKKIASFNSLMLITFGSVSALYDAAIIGSDFRLVITHLNFVVQAVSVNTIKIYNSTFFFLETGTISSVNMTGDSINSYQWCGFLSTNGVYETIEWTTGSDIIKGKSVIYYKTMDIYYQQ